MRHIGDADDPWLPPLQGIIPVGVRVQAMAREPIDGMPDTWDDLDVARTPNECLPGLTLCSETDCMESWLHDFFLRVRDRGVVVWTSPDVPASTGTPGSAGVPDDDAPVGSGAEAIVIPFPRRALR